MRDKESGLKYAEEDITNKDWLDLSPNERVLWWGRPSIFSYVLEILITLAFIGIAIYTIIYPPEILGMQVDLGIYPLIVVGICFLYIIGTLWERKWHYYVVTNSKFLEKYGILNKVKDPIQYTRATNITTTEPFTEQVISLIPGVELGNIYISTAEGDEQEMAYKRVPCVNTVSQLIEDCMYSGSGSDNQNHQKSAGNYDESNNGQSQNQQNTPNQNQQNQNTTQQNQQNPPNQKPQNQNTPNNPGGHRYPDQ